MFAFYLTRSVCTGVDSDRVCNDDTIEESDFHDNELKEDFDEPGLQSKKCERYLCQLFERLLEL